MSHPRILLAAPKSGSGKTMITCALIRALTLRGKSVRAFKCGPDYIDPMFHAKVLGIPSRNLDLFFTNEDQTRGLFLEDNFSGISVIEGVMGLYDGLGGILPYIMNSLHTDLEDALNPLVSPTYLPAKLAKGLPNAMIVYCDDDNLKYEALAYGKKLEEAGVPVATFFAERMPHGFIESGFRPFIDDFTRQFLGDHADELIESGLLKQRSCESMEFVKEHFIS